MTNKDTFFDIGCAKLDHQRPIRNGFCEVIFCQGKSQEHLLSIVKESIERGQNILATRASREVGDVIVKRYPKITYDEKSRTFSLIQKPFEKIGGKIAILAAGTADLEVAQEAYQTSSFFGSDATCFFDIGIAGLSRLISCLDDIKTHDVVIAIAGMEGALPSVVGGLISLPVIAVPTSVGYGTNLGGFTPLLAMLNSCAEGITVVNIDNGFGAACAALRILRMLTK